MSEKNLKFRQKDLGNGKCPKNMCNAGIYSEKELRR